MLLSSTCLLRLTRSSIWAILKGLEQNLSINSVKCICRAGGGRGVAIPFVTPTSNLYS